VGRLEGGATEREGKEGGGKGSPEQEGGRGRIGVGKVVRID